MREFSTVYDVPRGTAYFTAQQIIVYATSFLYYILFRILNLAHIGQISLLTATIAVFTTLTQLALPLAATPFISSSIGSQDPQAAGAVTKTCLRLTLTVASFRGLSCRSLS